jgi:hypothetical protein
LITLNVSIDWRFQHDYYFLKILLLSKALSDVVVQKVEKYFMELPMQTVDWNCIWFRSIQKYWSIVYFRFLNRVRLTLSDFFFLIEVLCLFENLIFSISIDEMASLYEENVFLFEQKNQFELQYYIIFMWGVF